MYKVTKAVIPAAGLGTRFLPATKTVPKEMLHVVDKPTLLYVVEEAVAAGIEDIVIIAGRGKTEIEDFFDCSYELEDNLLKNNKQDLLESVKRVTDLANIISIRQKHALGLGHAVATAKPVVGKEPFAVLLGDEMTQRPNNKPTVIGSLKTMYENTGISHVNVKSVEESEVSKYGIISYKDCEEIDSVLTYDLDYIVEKPPVGKAPSHLALPGRYVFTGEIIAALENLSPGRNGEIQLTDAMTQVARELGMKAVEIPCLRFDIGNKLGFIVANVEFAMMRPELKSPLLQELERIVKVNRGGSL